MLYRCTNRTKCSIYLLICCGACVCLLLAQQVAGAVQQQLQQHQEPTLSTSLPVIDGWLSLKTATHLAFTWSHNFRHAEGVLKPGGSSSTNSTSDPDVLRVARRGTALARVRAQLNRTVTEARFGLSGALRVTNPDPISSIVVDTVELQCLWGLSIKLPCSLPHLQTRTTQQQQQQQQLPALVIHPGETAQCYVHGLSVPAEWGTDFRQSCRAVATTVSGGIAQSGHFKLDFAEADVMTTTGNCIRLKAQCAVKGSSFFDTSGAGEQLQQGVLVCANKTLDVNVVVQDVFEGQGDMPDGCTGTAKLECSSEITTATTGSSQAAAPYSAGASGSRSSDASKSQHVTKTLALTIVPDGCTRPPPSPATVMPESGEVTVDDTPQEAAAPIPLLQQPKVSVRIDGTYIVSNFTWLVSSSVAPESLQVYANSTAAAQFSITALRVPVRPSVPAKYYIDGTITVENHHHDAINIASINAVLPWGQTAMCNAEGLVLPLRLDPSAKTSCTFRLQYDLGLKPSSLRGHVNLVGNPKPLKSWPKPFNFEKADWSWSAGACAKVDTTFRSDATDVSVTHAGGDAPAFDGTGTEICDDFKKWDFTVLVTPVGKQEGVAMVVANTNVVPTTVPGADPSSTLSRSAMTVLSAEVLPWPYTDRGPLLKSSGSWRRGGEVPLVSAQGGDAFLYADKNESMVININV